MFIDSFGARVNCFCRTVLPPQKHPHFFENILFYIEYVRTNFNLLAILATAVNVNVW